MKKVFALLLVFVMTTAAAAQDAGDLLNRIQKKYESMKNVCADFTQTFRWELAAETQVYEGTVCTRNGVQFKVETGDQVIITDGKTIWTMPRGNKQVIIDDAAENSEDNPFLSSFLQNFITNYRNEMLPAESIAGTPHQHIRLTAKNEDEFTKEVEIWVDQKTMLMSKIKQTDINNNSSTYEVRDIDLNAKLTDASFKAAIPADYEVVDLR
jgi:outer membrane lipoprotein-sorting protein